MHPVYEMYKSNNVIIVTCTSDPCFAVHTFFAVTTCHVRYNPLAEPVTVEHAWETLHICLMWNIMDVMHFINVNNKLNLHVAINNASGIIFTKGYVN